MRRHDADGTVKSKQKKFQCSSLRHVDPDNLNEIPLTNLTKHDNSGLLDILVRCALSVFTFVQKSIFCISGMGI